MSENKDDRVECRVGACSATVRRRNLSMRTAAGHPHVLSNRHIVGVLIAPAQVQFCACDAVALPFRYPTGKKFVNYTAGHVTGVVCTRCRRVRCNDVAARVALLERARSMPARIASWRSSERVLRRDLAAENAVAHFRAARRRLFAIGVALRSLALPVLLVVSIFEFDCERAASMNAVKRWAVARAMQQHQPRAALLETVERLERENRELRLRLAL